MASAVLSQLEGLLPGARQAGSWSRMACASRRAGNVESIYDSLCHGMALAQIADARPS